MGTQWQNFLQNLGEWQGSFTKISPQGHILEDIPSHLSLESLNDHQTVRLTLRRFPPNTSEPQELVREYQSLGRDILFFENGAFSQGTIQLAPFSQCGAEFGFIAENRRLRLVQLYTPEGYLDTITLIREQRLGTSTPEHPPLTLEALLGRWEGEATTLYPDLSPPTSFPTQLKLELDAAGRLTQHLMFGSGESTVSMSSSARIEGSILYFDESQNPVQVLLLPDGTSATICQQIQLRKPLFFEAGWLIDPLHRQRLIRRYNEKGEWVSLTLVKEEKIR